MYNFALNINNIFAGYSNREVLHDINLCLQPGLIYGLVGESGCGKSTLSRVLSGELPPQSGNIVPNILKDTSSKPFVINQDVFSSFDINQTVFECLKEIIQIKKLPHSLGYKDVITSTLFRFQFPLHLISQKIKNLSGGEKQRLALARAFLISPDFLIFDESLESLDMVTKVSVADAIKNWHSEKPYGAIFISHDLSLVKYCCDIIIVMFDGRIIEVLPSSFISQKNINMLHPYTKLLFDTTYEETLKGDVGTTFSPSKAGCPFSPNCFNSKKICALENPQIIEMGKKHYIACHFYCND